MIFWPRKTKKKTSRSGDTVVAVGVAVRLVPFPSDVPPHEPEYHFHVAPVPRVPPVIESTEVFP